VGDIEVRERRKETLAPVDIMGELLGCSATSDEDSLVLESGGSHLEFVKNASAARLNSQIVPLPSVVLVEGGHWWVEARSAVKAFSRFLGREYRWAGVVEMSSDGKSKSAVESTQAPLKEKPQAPLSGASPKLTLYGLRWGKPGEQIRAVIDLSSPLWPQVRESEGKIELVFGDADLQGFDNPENPYTSSIKVSFVKSGNRAALSFIYEDGVVKHFPLLDPPRYVVDFYLNEADKAKPLPPAAPRPVQPAPVRVAPQGRPVVVLDAGHGGKDPGATANGLREKEINLSVVKRVASILKNKGFEVRLTRSDDRYLKLNERTEMANRYNASVFVSLHCNALPAGRQAKGFEIYIMALPTDKDALQLAILENRELEDGGLSVEAADKKTRTLLQILGDMEQNAKIVESTSFAEVLHRCTSSKGISVRRVAQAPFFVLRGAAMPAVLLEMGYITNSSEAKLLSNSSYQQKLASAIADGIESYLR